MTYEDYTKLMQLIQELTINNTVQTLSRTDREMLFSVLRRLSKKAQADLTQHLLTEASVRP